MELRPQVHGRPRLWMLLFADLVGARLNQTYDMVGQTLAHFTILEKLGEGGMGEVYKARDNHLDRTVAIKVLPSEKVADPDRIRRFTQEAKAASALNHPNIVTIYDIDTADGVTFIAMEYVKGKTLDRLIRGKRAPLNETLRNAVQIADALAAAHNAGIIHRDIKPANIILSETGQVKLLDFGLAKLTERSESAEEQATRTIKAETTQEGVILGTIAYMSPEQAEGKKLDARSDIFSFGSVLYEMITGRRAFNGETKASTMAAILRENPKPASEVAAETPLEMEKIISRCLRKDPNRRFQHMLDLKLALEDLKEETESGRMVAGGNTAPDRFRTRKVWLVGFTAMLVATVLGVGLWLLRPRPHGGLRSAPLTTYEGSQCCPSFSPDGSQVAFVWDGPRRDMNHIYVKLVGTDNAVQLTNAPTPDDSPSWSPDGRYVAFFRHGGSSRNAVFRVPAIGGLEHKVAETSEGDLGEERCACVPPLRLSWSPDSKWVAVPDQGSVFAFSVESEEKRRMTSPPAGFGDEAPAFSPDGANLAFSRIGDLSLSEIYIVALSPDLRPKGEPKQLTFRHEYSWWPTWTAQGREIVFSTGPDWKFQRELWRVKATGRGLPRPSFTSLQGETPELSRRGDRLAYQRPLSKDSIWQLEMPGSNRKGDPPVKLISSTYEEMAAQYSLDGTRIAFVSSRSGHQEIWVSRSDGSNPVQLTSLGRAVGSPSWSPDGQHIAFDSNVEGGYKVFVIDASGGHPRRVTDGAMASWSRDGRWIYFVNWSTGEMQIWKIPAEGGDAIQLTKHGGYIAIESHDGRFLYFSIDSGPTSIWRIPVGGGEETKIVDSVLGHAFAVSAKGVYFFTAQSNGSSAIRFLSFATGQQTTVADVGKQPVGWVLSVTPDERYILYTQAERIGSDLLLVDNFQ